MKRGLWAARLAALATSLVVAVTLGAVGRARAVELMAYDGFSDVGGDEWFVQSGDLDYAVDHGLVSGLDDGRFNPGGQLTRGEAVTVLYRMAGRPSATAGFFSDVNYSAFYGFPIHWARLTGVASGYAGTNAFGPDNPVTREQLAVMLRNYAQRMNRVDTSSDGASLSAMPDAASVSPWARGAVAWALDEGIISGDLSSGTALVNPQGTATRAELTKMVAVLHRDVLLGRGPSVENAGVWRYEDGYVTVDFPISWKGVAQGTPFGHVLGNFHTDFYLAGHYNGFLFRVDGMRGSDAYLSIGPNYGNWGTLAWEYAHGRAGEYTRSELDAALGLVTGGELGFEDVAYLGSADQAEEAVAAYGSDILYLAHVR